MIEAEKLRYAKRYATPRLLSKRKDAERDAADCRSLSRFPSSACLKRFKELQSPFDLFKSR